jgi:hypothetical protein
MPWLRVPLHLSYLVYLGMFSRMAARTYLRAALCACKLSGTQPSILLHPLDFIGREDCPALEFFPGMSLSRARKLALVDEFFDLLLKEWEPVTMGEHARRAGGQRGGLRTLVPSFSA